MPIGNKLYRMPDHGIRAGESPSDFLVAEVKGTLSGGILSCTTPFKNAKDVGYVVLHRTTTNASGVLSADISKPGAADNCIVLVFAKGYDMQNEFS